MGNWGDDTDPEVAALKEFKVKFTINFKKIYTYVGELSETVLEVNEKHPRDSLMVLWAGTMVGFFIFFLFSYQITYLVTLPFMIFYFIAITRIFSAWKSFNYKAAPYWLMTVAALICEFAIAMVLQQLLVRLIT